MKRLFQFRPLVAFPRAPTTPRRSARFDSSIEQTMDLLDTELRLIQAKNAAVQLRLGDNGLTQRGMPKIGLPPEVVLSFELSERAVTMPSDKYDDWRDNLRAIALSLEALRKVDRHGVTQNGELYIGWAALPPHEPEGRTFDNKVDAALWLSTASGEEIDDLLNNPEIALRAYRSCAKRMHPDAGGNSYSFGLLQKVREIMNIK